MSGNDFYGNAPSLAGLSEFAESASWIDELTPAFGEASFFFEPELLRMYGS